MCQQACRLAGAVLWGHCRSACLVEGVVAPLPGLAAHIEVHIGGAAASAIGLHAAAPLPLEVLQPRQGAPRRALHGSQPPVDGTSSLFDALLPPPAEARMGCSRHIAVQLAGPESLSICCGPMIQHIVHVGIWVRQVAHRAATCLLSFSAALLVLPAGQRLPGAALSSMPVLASASMAMRSGQRGRLQLLPDLLRTTMQTVSSLSFSLLTQPCAQASSASYLARSASRLPQCDEGGLCRAPRGWKAWSSDLGKSLQQLDSYSCGQTSSQTWCTQYCT